MIGDAGRCGSRHASAARADDGGSRRWKAPDLGFPGGRFAEPDDLLVLCSEPGQGLTAEVGEFLNRLL